MANGGYDAIVVGAGPSGSACAALLARKGAKVLLMDKSRFPRDKVCGDAIGGKALGVLSELGLVDGLRKMGFARSSGIVFSSPGGAEVEIPLSDAGEMARGFVCKRQEFDSLLFSLAKKECETREETEVVDLAFENGRVVGVKAKGKKGMECEIRAKVVVGADGANSVVARKAGLFRLGQKHSCSAVRAYYDGVGGLRGNVEVHFLPECMPGYFWIFPLSKTEANVGVGMLVSDIVKNRVNLERALGKCMENPRFRGRFGSARMKGKIGGWTLPLASAKRRCAGNGLVLIGDAASLIDPFSGEGVGNGMKSGKIAADVLGAALMGKGRVEKEDCMRYEKALWKEIGADVGTSYAMQRLGKSGWILDLVVGKAKKSAWVQKELGSMIASREAKRKATDPLFYLKMLLA